MTVRNSPMALVRVLPPLCWAFALAVAAHQAWVWRDWMTIDGVGYLDMADAFRQGAWEHTVNGVWSPLYPAVLAAGLAVLQFVPVSEFQAVSAINLAIFVATLASYEFLLRQAFATRAEIHSEARTEPLPSWIWFATARLLFVWTVATMLPASRVTPDLLMAGAMFLIVGLLFQLARGGQSFWRAALFGAALGVGYLAKAIVFPLSFLFLGMLAWARRKSATRWREVATAAAAFAMVSGPYVAALTLDRGRLTFSDAGKLNYAWHVNGLPPLHWQGGPRGHGTPAHPPRKLIDDPAIYEFDDPVGGTLPVWYDPSYWNEGVKLRFDLGEQLAVAAGSLKIYWRIFAVSLGGFILLPVASLLLAERRTSVARLLAAQWISILPVAAALAAYGLVHVEGRYIAPFGVLFGVASLNALAMPRARRGRRLFVALAAAWLLALTAKAAYSGFRNPPPSVDHLIRLGSVVAAELDRQGVRRGDRIASFTSSAARWDRMLGVRIAAHAEWWRDGIEQEFWALRPEDRRSVYEKLGEHGLRGIVLEAVRETVDEAGWRQLGDSNHYWRPLPEAGETPAANPLKDVE